MDEQKDRPKEQLTRAVPVINLQRVYSNSFGIGVSLSDISVTLMINGRPSHQVFFAIPTVEALIKGLQKAVEDHEKVKKEESN